jgi:hypothetical protein
MPTVILISAIFYTLAGIHQNTKAALADPGAAL